MAFIRFEHKDNLLPGIKKDLMAWSGDYVHCEIVLPNYGGFVCSSWLGEGVSLRTAKVINEQNYINYDLGNCDRELYEFFQENVNKKYTIGGLVVNLAFNMGIPSTKTFCSQICFEAIQKCTNMPLPNLNPTSLSPQDIKNMLDTHHVRHWQ
jgi:hypothetical protein